MDQSTRFELRLPRERRRELDALADKCGLSSADVVRLAVRRLLNDPGVLLQECQHQNVLDQFQ
jgi:predicted DNA-binding protein